MSYFCEETRRWDKEIEDFLLEEDRGVKWAALALMLATAGVIWTGEESHSVGEWVDEF